MTSIAANPAAAALLNGTHPIVILTGETFPFSMKTPGAPAAWGASYMVRFSSEAQLQTILNNGQLPAFVDWVMYDNEPNTLPPTPANELPPNDPGPFFAAAAHLAHAAGKHFAATGGLSGTAQDDTDVYATASGWDLWAVQNQTGEQNLSRYDSELVNQMRDVWAVNPAVAFSSGVGDYAGGALALAPAIDAAMVTVPSNGLVWMNFGPNAVSPERDDIAIQVIEDTLALSRAAPLI